MAHTTIVGQKPEIGIVQPLERDSLLYADGYRYLSESIAKCFSPSVSDAQFKRVVYAMKHLKTKVIACNLFIPAELKLVGPDVREKPILAYAETVFERCRQAGMTLIVWGSGGARRIPDGFDKSEARRQFISIAAALAALAKEYGIVLALENLNRSETNFINTLEEAYDIVQNVDQPALRLNADIYHMMKENEAPSIIQKAGKYIVHCEVAEKEARTPPGTKGDDFRPYFRALKKAHFKGRVMMECRWDNLATQAAPARTELERQLADAFDN